MVTLVEAWRRTCADCHDHPFLITADRTWTYEQADSDADRLAAALLAMGVGKGGKVGIWMANGPEWVIGFLAAIRIGAVAVPLSTFYQAPELAWALLHNDIHTLLMSDRFMNHDYIERVEAAVPAIADKDRASLFLPDAPYLRNVVVWGDETPAWAHGGSKVAESVVLPPFNARTFVAATAGQVAPNDDCIIINTSGSTARPKAVVHTHESTLSASRSIASYYKVQPDEITYTGYPFFWIAGLNLTLLPTIYAGAAMAFSRSPKPQDAIRAVNQFGVTRVVLPPAQFEPFFDHAGPDDLRSIRGLEDCAPEDRLTEFTTNRGQAFGMTESFGMHSIEPAGIEIPADKAGAMGRGIPGIERVIRHTETGEKLPANTIGDLHIRGANVMRGYYKLSRSQVFDEDGFFKTGDRGSIDADGYFWFSGRANDMIKSSGANVAPREVELALEECEGVAKAFVFGIPDVTKGEAVVAVIVPEGNNLSAARLREEVACKVSSYKVPGMYFEMQNEALPRAAPWKSARELVDKRELRDWIMEGRGLLVDP